MGRITIGTKVTTEEYEEIQTYATFNDVSAGRLIKKVVLREIRGDLTEIERVCEERNLEIKQVSKLVGWLFDTGKVFVTERGIGWNPKAMTEEYFSIDEKIEQMDLSDIEKDRLKKRIASSLMYLGQDEYGNGGGV